MKTIGERIKDKRDELGLTQEELGKRLGVSNVAVAHTEADRGNITMNRVRKYAEALNCRVEELTQDYEQKMGKPAISFVDDNNSDLTLTFNEKVIIDRYRSLPANEKGMFLGHILQYADDIMNGENHHE